MINVLKGDITGLDFDIIVCPANRQLLPGAGINKEIFDKAGRGLLLEVMGLPEMKAGQAVMTDSYQLPCKAVIHTVGPVYNFDQNDEADLLASCYWNSMVLAYDYLRNSQLEHLTIAFPCISTGSYGFPDEQACSIAVSTIKELYKAYPEAKAIQVTFVTREQDHYRLYKKELAK